MMASQGREIKQENRERSGLVPHKGPEYDRAVFFLPRSPKRVCCRCLVVQAARLLFCHVFYSRAEI